MTRTEPEVRERRTRTNRVPRSRGAVSGLLLILLGIWGGLVPFIGPYLDYSYGSDKTWHWTTGRGWLEVLPGAVCLIGGLLLLTSKTRVRGSLGGWLAVLAGAWFVIGKTVSGWWHTGGVGEPVSQRVSGRAVADLGYFYGLGAVILFLAAFALGRLAVVGVRDIAAAERDEEVAAAQARRDAELARERDERLAATRQAEAARSTDNDRTVVADRPVTDQPVADRTVTDRPVTERPVSERPVRERSVADDRTVASEPTETTRRFDDPAAGQRAPDAGYDSGSDYNPPRGAHAPSRTEYDVPDGGNSNDTPPPRSS